MFKILAFPSHGQVQTISLLPPLATSFLFCSLFTFSLFLFIDQLLFVVIITVKLRFVRLQIREQRFETVSACLVFPIFSFFDTENKYYVGPKWSALVFGTS